MALITEAFAQETTSSTATTTDTAAAQSPFSSTFSGFIPLILIFLVFYFLLIRPQQKKMQEHRKMVESLKRGDKVVAAGGILGTIAKVEEAGVIQVEIAPEVKIRVRADSVTDITNRNEVAETKEKKPDNA